MKHAISGAAALAVFALTSTVSPALAQDAAAAGATRPCPVLRWTTLGTAGGPIPTPERSEPANLLEAGGQLILVDAGDGAVVQLARSGINVQQVQTLFISHHHQDHTGGVAALIGLRWATSAQGTLRIYGPPGTRLLVDGIVASMAASAVVGYGLGESTSPPADGVEVIEMVGGDAATLGDLTVVAAENSHFSTTPALPDGRASASLSYRFELGGRSITYTGDTGPSAALAQLASGSDMLVSEVILVEPLIDTMRSLPYIQPENIESMRVHFEAHHLTPAAAGQLAAEAGVDELLFTHLAVPPGPTRNYQNALISGARESFSGPVQVGLDLSSFDVGCR